MNMLIIYAHPNKDGNCGYLLKTITDKLDGRKKKYEVLDLYKMNFSPVLHPEEHYTSGNDFVTDKNLILQEKIVLHDEFIFIYPTWWNNVPAILKGFIDRIFVSGYAFKYVNKIPKGLLSGKALVITTTGGPAFFEKLIAKNRSLKVLTKDTLNFCGIKTKSLFIDNSSRLDETQKNKIHKVVNKGLNYFN